MLTALVLAAVASYSAPLTRVRIDQDRLTHTPSVFYASDRRVGATFSTELAAYGAQYLLQTEWKNGFGLQLGAGAAYAGLDLGLGLDADNTAPRSTVALHGYLAGGQARAYFMLWSGHLFSSGGRPSALTAFANLRAVYYSASGERPGIAGTPEHAEARLFSLSAGTGLMAELAVSSWLSICPYAWFSPGLRQRSSYTLGRGPDVEDNGDLSTRQPLRAGIDGWLYVLGEGSDSHIAVSAIASLFDTKDRGSRELSIVLGYTF